MSDPLAGAMGYFNDTSRALRQGEAGPFKHFSTLHPQFPFRGKGRRLCMGMMYSYMTLEQAGEGDS